MQSMLCLWKTAPETEMHHELRKTSGMKWQEFFCKPNNSVVVETERRGTRQDYVYNLYHKNDVLSYEEILSVAQELTDMLLHTNFRFFLVSPHFLALTACSRKPPILHSYDSFSTIEVGCAYEDKWKLRELLGSIGCDFTNDIVMYRCERIDDTNQPEIEGDVYFTTSLSRLNHVFCHWKNASLKDLMQSAKYLAVQLSKYMGGDIKVRVAVQTTLFVLREKDVIAESYLEIASELAEEKILYILQSAYHNRLKFYAEHTEVPRLVMNDLHKFWVE